MSRLHRRRRGSRRGSPAASPPTRRARRARPPRGHPYGVLYLFDGYNILHAGSFREREELIDRLASFVAMRGARGVVVFDGVGEDTAYGDLSVRYVEQADALIERLAAEHRAHEEVT